MAKKDENKKVTATPKVNVSGLSISRKKGTRKITAKWKLADKYKSKKLATRVESLEIDFVLDRFDPAKKKDPKDIVQVRDTTNESATTRSINLNSFKVKSGKKTKSYTRESFYPKTGSHLAGVTIKVWTANEEGRKKGDPAHKTYSFGKPGKPKISDMTQNEQTGEVTFKITAYDSGSTHNERYDTRYQVQVTDTFNSARNVNEDKTFTTTDKQFTFDAVDRQQLGYKNYIQYRARAMSRGFAGMSDGLPLGKDNADKAWTGWKELYVSYPNLPTISGITCSGKEATDKVTVAISLSNANPHPVTGVRLQYLVQSDATTPAEAVADDNWQEQETQDDGECTALAITVAELAPVPQKHTWVRVKSWNQFEKIFYRFSEPKLVKDLDQPVGADDTVEIVDVSSGGNGNSLIVRLGWTTVGTADTGTELSWSSDSNAWKSTKGPETYQFTWSDGPRLEGVNKNYSGTATVYITDLDEGTRYYVRARRYLETGDTVTYGGYTLQHDGVPVSSPTSVTLVGSEFVPRGSDVPLTWTYDSEAAQVAWQVITGSTETTTEDVTITIDGTEMTVQKQRTTIVASSAVIVASAADALGSTVIPASWFQSHQGSMVDGAYPLAVRMSTGGKWAESDAIFVRVVDAPTVSATVPEVVTTQPFDVSVECNMAARLSVVVKAADGGTSGDGPGGERSQADGDVVWQTSVTPDWEEVNGTYVATIASPVEPSVLDLRDNGNYLVYVKATDDETSLTSEEATARFAVNWARKAPMPSNDITVTPHDTTDESGIRSRRCVIALSEPDCNLVEFLAHDPDDQSYWEVPIGLTVEDGWATCDGTPTSISPLVGSTLTPGAQYTLLVELSEGEGSINIAESAFEADSDELDVGENRFDLTALDSPSDSLGITVTATGKVRLSLFEGDYDGSYGVVPTEVQKESDTYDLYRLTPDGPYLIASALETDATITDEFAPYGGAEIGYRVACRTYEGDINWADYEYAMPGKDLRIDFGGEYVELPWNLSQSDTYEKDFEARRKLSGDIDGYWNSGVVRRGGFSSDLIRIREQDVAAAVRRLARHVGPAFVRTPDGCAYQADVQVSDISGARKDAALAVTIDATEVSLTEEYMVVAPVPEHGVDPEAPDTDGQGG